ncbi:MAG: alpha/beta hydrolase [Pseudomonadales bacterium]|nr:alpha/beta hydrolase [Pseudomonadales bacterium]
MILRISLALALMFLGWCYWTYPKVGQLTYSLAAEAESRIYGIEEHNIQIEEFNYSYYDSAPSSRKETIVMLHGYTADKVVWLRFAKYFTDNYRVIIPDLAGHGKSNYIESENYSIPSQTARLSEFMKELGIEQAHIIGNSMGGFITADFALTHPNMTLSAGLVDPAGVSSPSPSDMDKMVSMGQNPFFISNQKDFEIFYPMTMAEPPWLPGFVLDAIADNYQQRRSDYEKIHHDFAQKNLLEEHLSELSVPTLLIFGAKDQLIHVSSAKVWQAKIPHLKTKIWEDLGHMPMLEAPTRSAELYLSFLNNL